MPWSAFILGHMPRFSAKWGERKPRQGFVATQADSVTTAAQGDSYHFWHRGSPGEEAETVSQIQPSPCTQVYNNAGPDWGSLPRLTSWDSVPAGV